MTFIKKVLDIFKLKEESDSYNEDTKDISVHNGLNIDKSSDNDVIKAELHFKDGEISKISTELQNNWYDCRYIKIDGKVYDLENVDSIKSIKSQRFSHIDSFDGYGITASLDYVLRMKAGNLYNRKEKELCSACLWKSTELMFQNEWCGWREQDFYRLVQWHIELGMFEEAEKAEKYIYDNLKNFKPYKDVIDSIKDNPVYIEQQIEFRKKNIDRKEYYMILYNIPDIAPKSFAGYRRMKNAKTKNFYKIAKVAIENGIKISGIDFSCIKNHEEKELDWERYAVMCNASIDHEEEMKQYSSENTQY